MEKKMKRKKEGNKSYKIYLLFNYPRKNQEKE